MLWSWETPLDPLMGKYESEAGKTGHASLVTKSRGLPVITWGLTSSRCTLRSLSRRVFTALGAASWSCWGCNWSAEPEPDSPGSAIGLPPSCIASSGSSPTMSLALPGSLLLVSTMPFSTTPVQGTRGVKALLMSATPPRRKK